MSKRSECLINIMAIISAAVAFATICNSAYAGLAVLIGAAFESRVQHVKAEADRREIRLRRRLARG